MQLINCEINLILTQSTILIFYKLKLNCTICFAIGKTKFAINNTKLYVPIVTLSTQDNGKLLEPLASGFKRTINWNKYQSNNI